MKKYIPIGDKIIVSVKKLEETSSGGIVLVGEYGQREDLAKEEGIVVAIGDSIFGEAYDDFRKVVKIGAKIMFPRYAGKVCQDDGKGSLLRVMKDVDILCVIEESEDE